MTVVSPMTLLLKRKPEPGRVAVLDVDAELVLLAGAGVLVVGVQEPPLATRVPLVPV